MPLTPPSASFSSPDDRSGTLAAPDAVPRTIDLVLEGGGARGLALNGAVGELERRGHRFNRLVGTSAGAIAATVVAAGYTAKELQELALEETPDGKSVMTTFARSPRDFTDGELLDSTLGGWLRDIDIPFVPERVEKQFDLLFMRALLKLPFAPNLFSLLELGGYYSADGFVAWLTKVLEHKAPGMSRWTFREMHERTGRHLSMVASDTDGQALVVLNHITTPNCPVLMGVRMSMSIPFFWPSVAWDSAWGPVAAPIPSGHAIVDGGITSNFALRLLVSDEAWVVAAMGGPPDPQQEVLGLYLDGSLPVPDAPPPVSLAHHLGASGKHATLVTRAENVLNTMMSANDLAESRGYPQLVCHLPVQGYGTLEFQMSPARIRALMRAGSAAVDHWLGQRAALATVTHARAQFLPR